MDKDVGGARAPNIGKSGVTERSGTKLKFKRRPPGFLMSAAISHDSEQFDYIVELHDWLWLFIRMIDPGASGHLNDCAPKALEILRAKLSTDPTVAEKCPLSTASLNNPLTSADTGGEHAS